MKLLFLLICLSVLIHNPLISVEIPADRIVDWSSAGLSETIEYTNQYRADDLGFDNSGNSDNSKVLNDLIKLVKKPVSIYFPSGTYLFKSQIVMSDSVQLLGESANSTVFNFDLGGSGDLINISGKIKNERIFINSEIQFNSKIIKTDEALSLGAYYLLSNNDSAKIFSDWALGSSGQIIRISDDNNEKNTSEFRREYKLSDKPYLIEIIPIRYASLKNIKIERLDKSNGHSTNIKMTYAVNCRVECIESVNCNFAHLEIVKSMNNQVSGSYFHDAFGYGGGGQAYGVLLHFTSGENLIYNNIFRHLRHSMIVQAGANGNVFAYNYSRAPFWTDVSLPEDSAGDMVCHGNYPYANLFEGNICQNIVVDNSHQENGQLNTFFRNRAENYGIFMNSGAGNGTNFIANEVVNTTFLKGLYIITGEDNYLLANNIKGKLKPDDIKELKLSSLYLKSNQLMQSGSGIGFPYDFNYNTNNAKKRYDKQVYFDCQFFTSIVEDGENNETISQSKLKAKLIKIEYYNLQGKLILSVYNRNKNHNHDNHEKKKNNNNLKGFYLVKKYYSNKIIYEKMLIY